ncbi:hypothetical protein [Clostridium felsineum]|uniref:Uncharacterized protein n=1 Tax=Clostridium felsineum TaxID=36839 RepID=A0A1S8L009_9CLOT|nr:hypothetical protein [Clostridium felsineum]URZ06510.1 hypothetical protein CLROS_018430 [Clostridium felsineum]URZ11545.1 hypothetical protein CROST_022620 [Clostridium felsineum]
MPIELLGNVEDVSTYQGKNGFGANITMSALIDKHRKTLTFNTKDMGISKIFEDNLQNEVKVIIVLGQSNFGLRFGDILDVTPNPSKKTATK